MITKSIEQTVRFGFSPLEVYNVLMDEKKHAAFTGSEVTMSSEVNEEFSIFDGYCHGYNIELIEGQKIVQAWHFVEDGWPDDHYSVCTFLFLPDGNGTLLTFKQTNIPEHKAEELSKGWKEFYWEAMEEYLKNMKTIKD